MAAKDAQGQTRMKAAQEVIRQRVRSLPDTVIVSLLAFDAKPSVLLSRSRNRRELMRLIDGITPVPREGKLDGAFTVARRLADLEKPSEIWVIGDSAPTFEESDQSAEVKQRFTQVALSSPLNVGITGFQIRKAPLTRGRYEAFAKVSAAVANPRAVTAALEVRIAGRLSQLREIELQPGASSAIILPLDGVRGQRLEIELKTPGDCLGWDNLVLAPLPELKPLIVSWFSDTPDPFTGIALGALVESGKLEILKGSSANWPPKEKPDLYVFEQWTPKDWPTDRPVIVLNPLHSAGPLRVRSLGAKGVPHSSIRLVAPDHPVSYRITSTRLAITQTSVFESLGSLEPLWLAGAETVLAAGEINGQRIVASAVSPSQSEQLALQPAFPLLLGNAIYWCAEQSDALSELTPLKPGSWLSTTGLVKWTEWDGSRIVTASDQPQGSLLEVRRLGIWETSDGSMGTSLLSSSEETNIPKLDGKLGDAPAPVSSRFSLAKAGGTWPQRLIWALLAVLLIESFLFHRKALY
jgi:hypothetical protein